VILLVTGCGVRPNNLRAPAAAPAGVPASPTAPVPPPDGTQAPGRPPTARGPLETSAPGPDAGL